MSQPTDIQFSAIDLAIKFKVGGKPFTLTRTDESAAPAPVWELSSDHDNGHVFGEFKLGQAEWVWKYADERVLAGKPEAVLLRMPNAPLFTDRWQYTTERDGQDIDLEIVLPMNVLGDLGALVHAAAIEIGLFGPAAQVEAA